MEERNALIKSTEIFIEDHGILTIFVHLDYGGAGQGFGGYGLDKHASVFIRGVMETVGVTKWSDLPGKAIRVRSDYGKIVAIGNILKDKWFYPAVELQMAEL